MLVVHFNRSNFVCKICSNKAVFKLQVEVDTGQLFTIGVPGWLSEEHATLDHEFELYAGCRDYINQ